MLLDLPQGATGLYASEHIQSLSRRLRRLQAGVLADDDREPLHQLRVNLRRLRTVLKLFGPALLLPKGVSEGSLARMARKTGLTRDLDVLQHRLKQDIAPTLSGKEQRRLAKVLQQLGEDRQRAFDTLVAALSGGRYRHLLAHLDRWSQAPRYGPLGSLPIQPWAAEWLAPLTAGLFLEEGWFCQELQEGSLHGLRKRLKTVRYAMELLEPLLQEPLLVLVERLKEAQDHLGNIHDLQVLAKAVSGQGTHAWSAHPWPGVLAALEEPTRQHWQAWLPLRDQLISQRDTITRDWLLVGQPITTG